ncbi:MAG: SusC/RagA family TonB-linked outer membrane protein [Bacteroidota bacterium]
MRKLITLFACVVLLVGQLHAQTRKLSGKVTDARDGTPLAGVSVITQDGKSGSRTGVDGSYTITVPNGTTGLVFSYVGFLNSTVPLGTGSSIDVKLRIDEANLSEVVVTSFGIKRDKKLLGYSTPTISAEDLTQVRNSNLSNSLVGKVAGVRTQGSGGSFTGSSILIRGYSSMTGGSQPLFVIDGVPVSSGGGGVSLQNGTSQSNRAVDINPDDVESMTVLKDASATSLYGSRAAGGVILITTKKGTRKSKSSVTVNSSYSVISVNRLPEYQNEYAQGLGVALVTVPATPAGPNTIYNATYINNTASSWGPRIAGQSVTNYFGKPESLTAFPNNVSDLFQNGYSAQNSASISGGTDKTTYRVSYSNTEETYVLRSNKLSRNNLSLNLNSEVTSKLTVTTYLNYNNTSSIRTQQGNQLANPIFRAWFIPRSYDLTNSPYYDPATGNQLFFGGEDNPYWSMENVRYNDEVNRFFGNVGLRYKFNSWLSADLKVGADMYTFKAHGFDEIGSRGGGNTSAGGLGGVAETRNQTRNYNSYLTLTGYKKFGNIGVTVTAGNEIIDNQSDNVGATATTLSIRGFDQLKNGSVLANSASTTQTRTVGAFAEMVLDYKHWLSLDVKARNDFPSTLPIATRSTFYPAASVSLNLTEALPSLKTDFVNQVKLRGGLGRVGNGPGAYNTDNYAVTGGASDGFGPSIVTPYNGLLAYTISNSAGNDKLVPEFTDEWSIGADIALWNNRIILEANYYQRKLSKGLFSVPVAASSGVTSVFLNAGEIETKGTELGLTLVPVRSKDFSWTISANYTQFKSMVTKLAPGVKVITLGGFTTPNVRLVEGDEYGQIYGSKYQRDAQGRLILQTTGNNAGLPLATVDVLKIGNPNAKYTIGISNTFTYKNFTLDFLIDIREGGDIYSRDIKDLRSNGVAIETAALPRTDKDGITVLRNYKFEGVDATGAAVNIPITAEQYYGNAGVFTAAEGFIFNTSWVRIREANVTYKFPKKLIDKSPFSNIEFGVFGRNLFLWAPNYPHFDPEQNAFGTSNAQGLEFNANASTRSMGVNLKLTF